jgi:hypothetical protein
MRWRAVAGLTRGTICMVGLGYGYESFIALEMRRYCFFFFLLWKNAVHVIICGE